jgi:hypothetical protein
MMQTEPKQPRLYKSDPILGPAFVKFCHQRANAKMRGIEWDFTFEEWWAWWQIDNRWAQRGNKPESLCMARRGDLGAYSPGNVYCSTFRENLKDAHVNGRIPRRRAS